MRKFLVATAAGLLASSLIAGLAGAQTTEVVVQAARAVKTKIETTASGVTINTISLSYNVSAQGIDLATHTGAMAFEKRVSDAALAACKELTRQYPLVTTPSDADCAKEATDKAMGKVHELEAAAAKKPAK